LGELNSVKYYNLDGMRKIVVFLFAVLIISCRKESGEGSFRGIWVEKTLRLDTLEFNPAVSSSLQSVYLSSPQTHIGYSYQIKTDSILLKSFASPGGFNSYYFNFNNSKKFTINNFFQRPALPATIQFEKIE
jgi:hypothetical protein